MAKPSSERPESVYGGLIPTLNNRGFMSEKMDVYSTRFAEYAGSLEDESLDMGCAYGVATLAALENGARILACDMDPGHLDILKKELPPEFRDRLRTMVGVLPGVDLPAASFGAILCSRVIHFLLGEEVRLVLKKMHRWLIPGGRLFMVTDTPYTGFWSSTAPEYEKRKAAGDEWPGLIEDISVLLESGAVPEGMLSYLNPMDPDVLVRECERAGFDIVEAGFTGRLAGQEGRHHAGVIAVKPV
jgi:SAM-dependent methyltransferase